MIVNAYRIQVEQAYEASAVGHRLSFDRWSGDTRDYRGWDEPVRVWVPDGSELATGQLGDTLLFLAGEKVGYTLQEAMASGLARYAGEGHDAW